MTPWDRFLDALERGNRRALRRAMQDMARIAHLIDQGDHP